ncbi:hypothetical protein JTE90_023184 [Oedothorax gibbosus]|uniref:Uncharacterized protein n=1 Tax=Oedothorax gibbosus TaxID=931172 RepID=A0AAV6UGC5_9ARAC|nr:hypothetical protein JTE90_023184 [Oedothorax gibbosus]
MSSRFNSSHLNSSVLKIKSGHFGNTVASRSTLRLTPKLTILIVSVECSSGHKASRSPLQRYTFSVPAQHAGGHPI